MRSKKVQIESTAPTSRGSRRRVVAEDFGGGNLFAAAQERVAKKVAAAVKGEIKITHDDIKREVKQYGLSPFDLEMRIMPLFDALVNALKARFDEENNKSILSQLTYGSGSSNRKLRPDEIDKIVATAQTLAGKFKPVTPVSEISRSPGPYPFRQRLLGRNRLLREFSRDVTSDELVWHRDREGRIVRTLEGRGWALQVDGALPVPLRLGESHHIPAGTWHRLLRRPEATTLRIVVELKKGDRVKHGGKEATVKVPDARGDLVGIDPAGPDDMKMVPGDELEPLREKDKKLPGSPGYYVGKKTKRTKSNREMAREIEKCKKEPRPKSCYDEWTADKTYKEKKQREAVADYELDALLEAVLSEGELSKKTRETLKKKAEKANMPLGALTAVYRKGLAAWLTGHRQGVPQHAWAMARTNSFISGGKARKVDSAEWKKVQKHRKKKG